MDMVQKMLDRFLDEIFWEKELGHNRDHGYRQIGSADWTDRAAVAAFHLTQFYVPILIQSVFIAERTIMFLPVSLCLHVWLFVC